MTEPSIGNWTYLRVISLDNIDQLVEPCEHEHVSVPSTSSDIWDDFADDFLN